MNCPHCDSKCTPKLKLKTRLGYLQFRCPDCSKQFNERTGTPYNYIEYPTEVVTLAVYLYYRFRNSLDNVVELMAMRGFDLSHQTIYNWAHRFGVEMAKQFRENRKGKSGAKWHVDPTYVRVEGRWCYLYRAIDKEGNLVDVYLSDVRDQSAAERVFMQAENTTGITPDQITTDKESALATAIDEVFGNGARHRTCKYLNNRLEAHHCQTKSRLSPMKGFKNIFSAVRFCTTFEEVRQFFRMPSPRSQGIGPNVSKIQKFFHIAMLVA